MGNTACCQKQHVKGEEPNTQLTNIKADSSVLEQIYENVQEEEGDDQSHISNVIQMNNSISQSKTLQQVNSQAGSSLSIDTELKITISLLPAEASRIPIFPESSSELVQQRLAQLAPLEKSNLPPEAMVPYQIPEGFYQGQWMDGKQNGWGKMLYINGSLYEGYWCEGRQHGFGRLIYPTGDVYNGEFYADMKQGKGTYMLSSGAQYTGDWQNDLQHGQGNEVWPDGSTYEGGFTEGLKHGFAKFQSGGNVYAGEFVANKMEGIGKFEWSCGKWYQGLWKSSKMHGHGIFVWPDGRKYTGSYVYDVKEGEGRFEWPDGKVLYDLNPQYYEGQWKDGKQHGHGVFKLPSQEHPQSSQWYHGKLVKETKT